jgi:hypothetical protein
MGIESTIKIDRIEFKIEATAAFQKSWELWVKNKTPWTPNLALLDYILEEEENKPEERVRFFPRDQTANLLAEVVVLSQLAREDVKTTINIINLTGSLYAKALMVRTEPNGEYKLKTLFLIGDKSTGLLGNL